MMLKIARAALFAILPMEVILAVLLVSGVALPHPVVIAAELAVLTVLLLEASALWRRYRALRQDGARRTGAVPLSYHREQTGLMFGFLFACMVELVCVEVLLRALSAPAALRGALLALGAYGVLFALTVIAGLITRPHIVTADELRLRYGAYFDLRIPRSLIAGVQHKGNYNETGTMTTDGDCLALAANSQTNLIVELAETVVAARPLGRREHVRVLRFFADDPSAAVKALRPSRDSAATGPAGRAG